MRERMYKLRAGKLTNSDANFDFRQGNMMYKPIVFSHYCASDDPKKFFTRNRCDFKNKSAASI